jgi:hypothetical protein
MNIIAQISTKIKEYFRRKTEIIPIMTRLSITARKMNLLLSSIIMPLGLIRFAAN